MHIYPTQDSPDAPKLPSPDMAACTGTEYVCTYNFKADNVKGSKKLMQTALLTYEQSGKTEKQIGR